MSGSLNVPFRKTRDCGNETGGAANFLSFQIQQFRFNAFSLALSLSLSFSSSIFLIVTIVVTPVPHGTRKLAEKIDTSRHVGRKKKFTLQRGFLEETSAIVGRLDRCIMGFRLAPSLSINIGTHIRVRESRVVRNSIDRMSGRHSLKES